MTNTAKNPKTITLQAMIITMTILPLVAAPASALTQGVMVEPEQQPATAMTLINEDGGNLLHIAARAGNIKLIRSLIASGVNPNARDEDGDSPLHLAAKHGHSNSVKILIEAGVDPNIRSKNGLAPLHFAVFNETADTIIVLLDSGADLGARDKDGWTALHWAGFYGYVEPVEALIAAGADLNFKGKDGWTPINSASYYGSVDAITTPFAVATFWSTAVVTPEQSAPMIALTPSEVIRRSAVDVAAPASTQVESPRTGEIVDPPMKAPLSLASFIASLAPFAISGVNDSIGPVKPSRTPILTSAACAGTESNDNIAIIRSVFFMLIPPNLTIG